MAMSRIGEWIKRVLHLAKGHPGQADQIVERAERLANERTRNKYGDQIGKGADALRRQYRGGGGDAPERRP
jgi:hypothetical protein